MFLKIFLAIIIVGALLGCIGANQKENKHLAAVIALAALILFTVSTLVGDSRTKNQEAAIAGKGDTWGTITIKDGAGETREYYWKEKEKE